MVDATENRKSLHRLAGAILAAMLLLPVLYVLSIGPAAWLCVKGYIDSDSSMAIYWPVLWLAGQSQAPKVALGWYISLWK
jgi:hypothetical protein